MEEKQLKPVLCVMNPDDIYWMKEKKEISKFSGNVLSPYEAKEMEITQGIVFPEIRENVIYMLDPTVKNKYIIRTESTDADIVERRINAIEVIVSLLGGKSFCALSETTTDVKEEAKVEVEVNVDTPKVEAGNDTQVDSGKTQGDKQKITITSEFKGEYSKENYFKAIAIAEQYGLIKEPTISSLLMTRHPDNCNEIRKKKYSVSTFKELQEYLDVANNLKVSVMNAVNVSIDVNVNTSKDKRCKEVFEFEVEFGPVKADPIVPIDSIGGPEEKAKTNKWIFWVLGAIIVALAIGLVIALI